MPIRKQDYHPNWPAISLQVREDAGQKCEWCEAPNGKIIERGKGDAWKLVEKLRSDPDAPFEDLEKMTWKRMRFFKVTRVVLTVAHLDRNSHNNDRHNLAALCQRCHLKHDIHQHIRNRKFGRYHTREHQLKLQL